MYLSFVVRVMQSQAFLVLSFSLLIFMSLSLDASIYGRIWSNLGWRAFMASVGRHDLLPEAYSHFSRAAEIDLSNQSAFRGLGMVSAARLDESGAQSFWRVANTDPSRLNQMGRQIRAREQLDVAFIYFRSAAALEQSADAEGDFLAGKLCQSIQAEPQVVSVDNQQYCEDRFEAQDGNLLLDGQFNYPLDLGWSGAFFFTNPELARAEIDLQDGVSAPSLRLSGFTEGRHAGIFQRIAIPPGATIHFSGYFRVASANGLETPLLYVEWRDGGKVQGTSFYKATENMDWTYLEGTMTLPSTSEPWMNFYPALLIGRGVVWSDDMAVKILDQE